MLSDFLASLVTDAKKKPVMRWSRVRKKKLFNNYGNLRLINERDCNNTFNWAERPFSQVPIKKRSPTHSFKYGNYTVTKNMSGKLKPYMSLAYLRDGANGLDTSQIRERANLYFLHDENFASLCIIECIKKLFFKNVFTNPKLIYLKNWRKILWYRI